MKIEISPEIRDDRERLARVQKANRILEDELGPSGAAATAEWYVAQVPRLRLSDQVGSVEAHFAWKEFDEDQHLRSRLHRVWGDLLQARSSRLVRELAELVQAGGGD